MGLEDFIGLEQNSAMDAAAFERFQERVKAAAAQIQASKKEEKKRKKKEDELVKILLKFIKSSNKKDLVLLISRVLEKNIPANFILAIILLGNEEIQKEVGEYLSTPKAQPEVLEPGAPEGQQDSEAVIRARSPAPDTGHNEASIPEDRSLVFFQTDQTMPLKVRIEIDKWIRDLIFQASETPQKLLSRAYDVEEKPAESTMSQSSQADNLRAQADSGNAQADNLRAQADSGNAQADSGNAQADSGNSQADSRRPQDDKNHTTTLIVTKPLVLLVAHVIFNFLKQNGMEENIVKMKEFAEFLLNGILNRVKEDLGKRKELGEKSST